jgi:hypothetical protein
MSEHFTFDTASDLSRKELLELIKLYSELETTADLQCTAPDDIRHRYVELLDSSLKDIKEFWKKSKLNTKETLDLGTN